ncbi:MAG: 2-succinyl-5-enolpyruvyl-6-hydroxy-3-cyclohexene-1-carboxylic-acid synthase, partial [Paramuribaculum sp.]|nr:2-succinyl-5-enolpyruvyl-6-hydroxy-3-cyclohexene-1-carboxylic-acid synthase [Paramuribaculum sp.]
DVVITLGGALVSRFVKTYLRKVNPREHWHVGLSHTTIDCFQCLTTRIEIEPEIFFPQLASAMQPHKSPCNYADRWRVARDKAISTHQAYISKIPWSDLKAFSVFIPKIPKGANIQLSNGTSIRYAQLMGDCGFHRCDCNRGVSGIDGSTSTAIGAALAYNSGMTVLITGDMSAQYDLGALATNDIPANFKIIVMCNGGGGIFRFINTTSDLPELEKNFAAQHAVRLPLESLAKGFGFGFYRASDEEELRCVLPQFIQQDDKPSILAIETPPQIDAEILKNYFKRSKIFKNSSHE